jgi:MFS family permease
MVGTMASVTLFGLATNFWVACFARFAWGLLNGNIGIAKTLVAESCTVRQQARAFSGLGVMSAVGRLLGPLIATSLGDPRAKGWRSFQGQFWESYPYALACAATLLISFVVLVLAALFLRETLVKTPALADDDDDDGSLELRNLAKRSSPPARQRRQRRQRRRQIGSGGGKYARVDASGGDSDSGRSDLALVPKRSREAADVAVANTATILVEEEEEDAEPSDSDRRISDAIDEPHGPPATLPPPPRRRQLWRDRLVLTAASAYALLALVGMGMDELIPLLVVLPPSQHGFSFESSDLSWIYMSCAPVQVLFQLFVYPRLAARFVPRRLLAWSSLILIVFCAVLFPAVSLLANARYAAQLCVLATVYSVSVVVRLVGFTSVFVLVSNSAPDDASRGGVNGVGQTFAALARIISPPFVGTIFAWSLAGDRPYPFNFTLAFTLCAVLSAVLARIALGMPPRMDVRAPADGSADDGEDADDGLGDDDALLEVIEIDGDDADVGPAQGGDSVNQI